MKYDIYESFVDGVKESKLTKQEVKDSLTKDEIKRMVSDTAEIIVKDNFKYWAEEAMNYSQGIAINSNGVVK